ncbi:peptidase C39 [Dulcicalothrix desertica PCC 7102]|uniref:Peptidase C39 n=1 Tax=Dulcicalothrix desertica PCC 7102 TaxID=232991 RepID=A0A3S1CWW3_9CYAN|nr:peptidase domain-containing ABC transporter [Dulcicalothrix desertica]RUT10209.1 peptidase C39 [Dulcicalothrix desertica PCC 7102]TWH40813.1 ATP-binding cassette subfamily B protein [Dulcicalothrix desertica PCC 7102]
MKSTKFVLDLENISQQLAHMFGVETRYISSLHEKIQIVEPPVGKQFWQAEDGAVGIYLVLAGKVRLFDKADNLIVTLSEGESFGEVTLFSDKHFQAYSAKASLNLKLCYLNGDLLKPLLKQHPNVKNHLHHQAIQKDLLIVQFHQSGAVPTKNKKTEEFSNSKSEVAIRQSVDVQSKIPNPKSKINQAYFPSPTLQVSHWWQKVIRRYPLFEQQSAADCGAACLVMIGRYWGKDFSINHLRSIAEFDRNGISLRNLAFSAESVGFATRPVKASLDKLGTHNLPAIAHWEGKHYIVVYEVAPKYVVIADPAIGQRVLTNEEFQAGWTGYALLLTPTVVLKDVDEKNQPLWVFLKLLRPHKIVLIEVLFASVLLQIFGLVTPLFTQLILDRVVVQRSELTLTAIGLGLLIFGVMQIALTALREYLLDHTANRVDLALIVGFINHTFRLPLSYFESRYVGDIISRVQENQKIQKFFTDQALSIFMDMLTVFVYLGLMFWYSWRLTLLTLIILPPYILLALCATPFLRRVSRKIFATSNEETGYLIQSLTGISTIKSMAIEQTVRWKWEELFGKSIKASFSGQLIGNVIQSISSSIEMLATIGLLWLGAWQVIHNELTIGQLVAFNMLLGNVINPFQRITRLWDELQEVIIAIERINDVIEAKPEEDLQSSNLNFLPPINGHVCFKNVTFRYQKDADANILENINFEVQPGQIVALVGRSGSGKTTLAKLLLGLYLPTDGKILIDGADISTVSVRSLRQQIGVVDQDTFMFGGTIHENISIAYPEAPLEEIIEVSQLAGAHQFINSLPMGYETQIGEGGGMLSGGQRQRIAIARALLGNPQLLVLDEATSSLDTESERIIQNNLSKILKGRTTLIIAHRLSTVRNADLILVLDKGLLVESGNHNQLMAKRGLYFYLNQQQVPN